MENCKQNCKIECENIINKNKKNCKTKQGKNKNFENFFENGKIDLSKILHKKKFLRLLGFSLFCLSDSCIIGAKLCVGGIYHKNYYNHIKTGFLNKKSTVLFEKNAKYRDFGAFVKQNMCNYGIWMSKKNNKFFVRIFCGNGCILEKTQQNFVAKIINECK